MIPPLFFLIVHSIFCSSKWKLDQVLSFEDKEHFTDTETYI